MLGLENGISELAGLVFFMTCIAILVSLIQIILMVYGILVLKQIYEEKRNNKGKREVSKSEYEQEAKCTHNNNNNNNNIVTEI